jgi:hypothetical protein
LHGECKGKAKEAQKPVRLSKRASGGIRTRDPRLTKRAQRSVLWLFPTIFGDISMRFCVTNIDPITQKTVSDMRENSTIA